jgi:hypothetical protein
VEPPAAGRWEDMGPPAEEDGGSTAAMKGDHVDVLKAECRLGDTWAERRHSTQAEASSSSPPPSEHDTHPPTQ